MSFFKAYDMRGTFGVDFDLELIYRVGCTLPKVIPGRRWLVGRDCRLTSPAVRDALVNGLLTAGVDVTDLGLCTTPMIYFFTAKDDFDGSVMITASHNPPTDNGLKVSRRTALPVGLADGLDEVARRVETDTFPPRPETAPQGVSDTSDSARKRYLAWLREQLPAGLETLSFAVDCSNGMSSLLARALFPLAQILNDTLDGSFRCHSPNPLQAEARKAVAACVRAGHLDCGLIFDGDADRAMFVDETGAFVPPDLLIPLVAAASRAAQSQTDLAEPVIHDVRTSRGVIEALRADGFEPVMVPVGHAFAKPRLRESGALCGGELAGHYYFRDFFGCDSGVLAALRILGEIARAKARGVPFSCLVAPIRGRWANSGELNFRVADKTAAIARVLACARAKMPLELTRTEMDGVRLEYDAGWVSVRASNTEPFLRLLIEADTPERLAIWTLQLTDALKGDKP